MQNLLDQLRSQIFSTKPFTPLNDQQWNQIKDNITVAFMAGGESSRFQSIPGANESNKNGFKLPNGDTMMEMTLRMYRDAGITNMVCLLYHKGEQIEELLGDGSKHGVKMMYSYDPGHAVGKGGAVLNALQNGAIAKDKILIVHNPTDLIFDYDRYSRSFQQAENETRVGDANRSFVKDIMARHLQGVEQGTIATVVVVKEQPFTYTGMMVQNSFISEIEMYPMVPVPAHIGVTIFNPQAFEYFPKHFNLEEKSDFEQVLFPILSKEKKLYAADIPTECWLPVKDLKGYKALLKKLG